MTSELNEAFESGGKIDYEQLFESSPGLYLVLSPEFFIVTATNAYLSATMTVREQIVGKHLFEVFPDNPDDEAATGEANLRASLELVRRDLVPDAMALQHYDVRRPESEGGGFEERYWSPLNVPILDEFGRLQYILHRVEDVTEMVRLHKIKTELEELTEEQRERTEGMLAQVVQRSSELQRANQRLVDLDQAKSDFLSRMSHELRTPLNSILGFSQLLRRESLTEDQFDSIEHIAKAGQHLLQLVNEVLDIARIESRQMDISLEPVDLVAALDVAIRLMHPMADAQDVAIHVAPIPPTFVQADSQRMQQVLLNLLSNAIKYNRPGGKVSVKVDHLGSRVRLYVADTGIGIAAANFAAVFEPFSRLGAEQTSIEGTGIGLALIKRVTELMRGSIGFDSTVGEGSTFWVELDRAASSEHREERIFAAAPAVSVRGWAGSVLYVEDNLANLTLVTRIFRPEPNVVVHSAMQGRIGLQMAREIKPRLILLDVHLPDMNGLDMLVELKRDGATASIPVVVLSADATDRQIQRLLAAGAEAYLTKPLDIGEFERVVGPNLRDHGDNAGDA